MIVQKASVPSSAASAVQGKTATLQNSAMGVASAIREFESVIRNWEHGVQVFPPSPC